MSMTRREALAFMTSTIGMGAMAMPALAKTPEGGAKVDVGKDTEPEEETPAEEEPVEEEVEETEPVTDDTDPRLTQATHNQRGNSDPQEPFVVMHISDVHGDAEALERAASWADAHSALLDDVVATGDLATSQFSDGMRFWKKVEGAKPILTCIGNHDVFESTETKKVYDKVSVADAADQYIDSFVRYWGDIDHEDGTTWYAKDYPERSVRLVVLDCMLYLGEKSATEAADQNGWLEETLADAREKGYTVVVAEHYPLAEASMVECSWAPFDRKFAYGPFLAQDVSDRVQAFIDAGGKFACYLCGHTHCDGAHILPSHPEQFALTVPCTSDAADQAAWGDMDRSQDATRDAFNVVMVDTANGLIKVIRIGADRDLALQHRSTLCWDYRRHRLVHAD